MSLILGAGIKSGQQPLINLKVLNQTYPFERVRQHEVHL